jgi:hypothetical protein
MMSLLMQFTPSVDVLKMEVLDMNYRFGADRHDQTRHVLGECAIECVLRKRTALDQQQKGRLPPH